MTRRYTPLTLAAFCLLALALPALAGAKARDRNHDRIPDRWEKRHHLSLAVNQARRDQDRDHLRNRAEFQAGTNPRSADSDGDGIPDGQEHAGTIESFEAGTGMLTVDLFGGGTIEGLVTADTEIECEHQSPASSSSSSAEDDEGEDDHGESGEEEEGDEEENEDESGDDHGEGGSNSTCTTADLVPGTTVHEAELRLANGEAVFEKVELGD
jgi:hypothetical protein